MKFKKEFLVKGDKMAFFGLIKSKEEHKAEEEEKLQVQNANNLFFNELRNGNFKNLPPVRQDNLPFINLKKGEHLLYRAINVFYDEPRSVRVSNRGGGSVRVAKGFWLHSGQSRSVSHDQMTNLDAGNLVFTNKRLIFVGKLRSVDVNYGQIVSFVAYTDGFLFNKSGRQKPFQFRTGNNRLKSDVHGVDFKVNGVFVRSLIQGCLKG